MQKLLIIMLLSVFVFEDTHSATPWFTIGNAQPTIPMYNHKTSSYDYLTGAPENYEDYLPDTLGVHGLFKTLMDMGKEPSEAYLEVMLYLKELHEERESNVQNEY